MAWRGLHISHPAALSLSKNRIQVAQDGREDLVSLPLEDLAWIVLDTPQVTVTTALLSACMSGNVPVIFTDQKHTPNGVIMPFHQHYAQAGIAVKQMSAGAPLKKRLWQVIVRQKITNQAAVLDRAQLDGGQTLRAMCRHVGSGDPGNVEARAARHYWGRLFVDFRRHDDGDRRNAMLNYAYAILRAAVARGLVAAGLLPAFGVHHASVGNAFNLADDLLEVLRPAADWMVFGLTDQGQAHADVDLSRADRQALLAVAEESFIFTQDGDAGGDIGDNQLSLIPTVDRMVASLVRAFSGNGVTALDVPRF